MVVASDGAEHIYFMKDGKLWYMNGIGAVPRQVSFRDFSYLALSADGSVLYGVTAKDAIWKATFAVSGILFAPQTIPDRLKNCGGGPLHVAISGDGNHLWAANMCLEVFYKGPGQPEWARHEDTSARMRVFAVSRSGNHVWGIGKSRKHIWYHPGQFGGSTGWRSWCTGCGSDGVRGFQWIAVSGSDGENLFATDIAGDLYYFNRAGNEVKKESITAPNTFIVAPYNLAAVGPEQLEFQGEWEFVGLGLSNVEMRAISSWSTTEDRSVTESFTWGLSQEVAAEVKTGFLVAGSKVTVTVGSSQEWGESITSTISNMQGGQDWFSCGSLSCTSGNMYQWVIKGTSATGHVENIKQCSFVCVPSATRDEPTCPPRYCGDGPCQCCNGDWAEGGNPPSSPLCTASKALLGDATGMCYGCD
jgi:hypothetical protein